MAETVAISVAVESFPTAGRFTISRGSRTEARVVLVTLDDGRYRGRGEATPYARYGETIDGVVDAIRGCDGRLKDRDDLPGLLGAGAARNALDCALVDLEAKRSGRPAHDVLGLAPPMPVETVYTISLDTPQAMADKARAMRLMPVLKLKLGGPADLDRLSAVRMARPEARILVDANEGWSPAILDDMLTACAAARVELVEQPLPAGQDEALAGKRGLVRLGADESVHTRPDLGRVVGLYDAINIKLDKTGGLTEALALRQAAHATGLEIMVGCMLATSLAMAPALLVAQGARWVDLDAPLLLAADRSPPMRYDGATVHPASGELWG
ncbi:MAG: dipeptide epimerase [Hyphomicrobiales bacterium]|nr:dipeptide epimerase [Hyphomicrobiales bacterium]